MMMKVEGSMGEKEKEEKKRAMGVGNENEKKNGRGNESARLSIDTNTKTSSVLPRQRSKQPHNSRYHHPSSFSPLFDSHFVVVYSQRNDPTTLPPL